MKNKIKSIFILARPVNCLIAFISAWAGAVVAGDIYISVGIVCAGLGVASLAAFGNAVNDILDIETDSINKPFRPLPSGALGKREAIAATVFFAMTGLLLSLAVDRYAAILAAIAILLMALYTPVFKGLFFAGNFLVAFVASLAFIFGGIAAGKPFGALILTIFAFLFHLGREVVKDVQDMAADINSGRRTGASIDNGKTARTMAAGVFGLLVIATIIPYLTNHYGIVYLITVVAGVDLVLSVSIARLMQTDDPEVMRRIAVWLKAVMPLGLLAVLFGSRGW